MAGDIKIRERAIIQAEGNPVDASMAMGVGPKPRVVHVYGTRLSIVEDVIAPQAALALDVVKPSAAVLKSLSPEEQLGYSAFKLRESAAYLEAKDNRPRDGESWDFSAESHAGCVPSEQAHGASATMLAGAPTSQRLTGSVAVGIVIVEGPNSDLKFSEAERTKVIAEVQNGLGWLATQNPEGLVFKYDIKIVTLSVQPGANSLSFDEKETLWRNPAMKKLGFTPDWAGVTAYVESLRTNLGTNWTYCAFFTKYPLGHFAYASIGGPRLVMHYENDGWGPDNIDRVFAHESGHIFGAPDEYASSNCTCGGSWGFYGKPNSNCENCAPGGGVECLMKANTWAMCPVTPYHLGFPLVAQTYTGVWRQGNDAHYLWVNASWQSFVAKWQQLSQGNLRLTDLKITRENNVERYHGVWRQGSGGHYLWVNASQANFVSKWQELAGQGLRLVDLEVQNVNGNLLYSGVWLPGNDAYYLWINADWNSFVAKWQQLAAQNLRLVDIKIVNVNGAQRFFGVWRQGTGAHYLWVNADWNNFVAKWKELGTQGLRLVDIEITQSAQGQRYSGVWLPGTDSYYLWSGASWQNFLAKFQEVSAQNLRLVDIDVVPASGAMSPVINSSVTGFGGLAVESSSMSADDEQDGMGAGGQASSGGDGAGFGIGYLDGEAVGKHDEATGLVGDGGGWFASTAGGMAEIANGSDPNSDDGAGTGGGATLKDESHDIEYQTEGIGMGALA